MASGDPDLGMARRALDELRFNRIRADYRLDHPSVATAANARFQVERATQAIAVLDGWNPDAPENRHTIENLQREYRRRRRGV